ncbi:MAG: hypothetical protein ACKVS6_00895 [Planctomycetota bacterium]
MGVASVGMRYLSNRSWPCLAGLLLLSNVAFAGGVSVTAEDVDGNGVIDIKITGSGAAERIVIIENGANGLVISVDANNDGDFDDEGDVLGFNAAAATDGIFLTASGGGDICTITFGQDLSVVKRHIYADLGSGDDIFTFSAGDPDIEVLDIADGSNYLIEVIGSSGHDTVNLIMDLVWLSRVSLRVDTGSGNDIVDTHFYNQVFKSNVDMEFVLGNGNDTMTAVFEQNVQNGSTFKYSVDGGAGADLLEVSFAGSGPNANSIMEITLLGDRGDDTITVDGLQGGFHLLNSSDSDCGGRAIFNINGGDGKDNITMTRLDEGQDFGGFATLDGVLEVNILGGRHDDTILVNFAGANGGFTTTANDAERRGLQLWISGGDGNDTVDFSLTGGPTFTGYFDILLEGNAGNDIFTFSLSDFAQEDLGPGEAVVIDGGAGTGDSLSVSGGATVVSRRFEL